MNNKTAAENVFHLINAAFANQSTDPLFVTPPYVLLRFGNSTPHIEHLPSLRCMIIMSS
jgi:hypothetical protein